MQVDGRRGWGEDLQKGWEEGELMMLGRGGGSLRGWQRKDWGEGREGCGERGDGGRSVEGEKGEGEGRRDVWR